MAKTKQSWNKLVRDKIPEILKAKGIEVTEEKITEPDKLRWLLREKLQEETEEAMAGDKESVLAELGDVLSVAYAIAEAYRFSKEELDNQRKAKDQEKGGFKNGVFLVSTEEDNK